MCLNDEQSPIFFKENPQVSVNTQQWQYFVDQNQSPLKNKSQAD
ncbi:hypothetical protein N483_26000 [Pseudoalteromonas luteoviolacea NCIMB 1944]|nr:hypothetical protein N483_26000 [Pseudoalteromonas luteoviolacea NCIMB 1944]